MDTQPIEKLSKKDSAELIVYQLGEVKTLIKEASTKIDNNQDKTDKRMTDYQEKTDKRLLDLEKFQTAQLVQNAVEPKIDVQKIILAALSLVSTVVAIALGINQKQ